MPQFSLPRYNLQHQTYVLVSLGIWLAIATLAGILFLFGPPMVPMWYSLVQPEEQLAPSWALASFPIASSVFLFLGFWFGRRTDLEHEIYLASLSWWGQILLQGLLLLALLRIMKVVV